MKKIIVIAFVLLSGVSNAQVTFKPGLRAGATLSTFSNTQSHYKTDFYVGAFGEINLTKVYALQPEITYSRQGSNNVKTYIGYDENTYDAIYKSRNLEIDYLSIAMINKFTFRSGFQVMAGPTVDFRVQDNLIYENSDVDLALAIGFGYRLPSGLAFEARFKKGVLDILDSDYYSGNTENNDYWFRDYNTNINFQLGVSYSFGGKK